MSEDLSNYKLFIDPLFVSTLSNNHDTSSIFLEEEPKETNKKYVIQKYDGITQQIQQLKENSRFVNGTNEDLDQEKDGIEYFTKMNLLQIHQQKEIFYLNSKFNQFCHDVNSSLQIQKPKKIEPKETEETQKKPEEIYSELKRKYSGQVLQAQQKTKKKKKNFQKQSTDHLNMWFFNHLSDPYPTDDEKKTLSEQTGLNVNQVNNWFGNKRMRYKRKMLEDSKNTIPTPTIQTQNHQTTDDTLENVQPSENSFQNWE
eukprot:gene9574-1777_t